ncbi:MAG: hypothetical protein HC897_20480 [Thermoanaerobaculia bacterium]|nr:hypothetical protein [Thermoanaerobaculia bacterium]
MERAIRFREAAAEVNRHREKNGWRYPERLRRLAVDHCREQRCAGRAWSEIAEELGVSAITLGRWLAAAESMTASAPPASFHPVEVVEAEPKAAAVPLRVVTPGGLQIEGLDFGQVLVLARVWR